MFLWPPVPDGLQPFFEAGRAGDPVVGCYLWPKVALGEFDWDDAATLTEIRWKVPVGDREILVTTNGGMFVRVPDDLAAVDMSTDPGARLDEKVAFEQQATSVFNLLVCELATYGVVSEPASPTYISAGRVLDGRALVTGAAGGREIYVERAAGWAHELLRGSWRESFMPSAPPMADVCALRRATAIAGLSPDAPTLVATAYSARSRMHHAETLICAWIVIEQYIDQLWTTYRDAVKEPARRKSLNDTRTYTAAVRLEVLALEGAVTSSNREIFDRLRKDRNNLAHGGRVDPTAADDAAAALRIALREVCGAEVAPLLPAAGINW